MNPHPDEGMRARKRRQTHEKIAEAALSLFLERGFESVTVDDIAARADVSKRSFFDYFPTKEDVLLAWQDDFGAALAVAVAARPSAESLAVAVEEAMVSSIAAASQPRAIAIAELIQRTPLLRARDHLKYARLEGTLAVALAARVQGPAGHFRASLLAMIVIGTLRIASETWLAQKRPSAQESAAYTRQVFRTVWTELAEFAKMAKPKSKRKT